MDAARCNYDKPGVLFFRKLFRARSASSAGINQERVKPTDSRSSIPLPVSCVVYIRASVIPLPSDKLRELRERIQGVVAIDPARRMAGC